MGFFEWLRAKPEINAPPPPERERGPVEDDWERDLPPGSTQPADEDRDGRPDTIAGICIVIDYIDASGAKSNRRVICERISEENDVIYLSGHCLLRDDFRTFRADRIQRLRIPPDWIIVANPLFFLRGYVSQPVEKLERKHGFESDDWERYQRMYEARNAANHGLRVLTFVARADGAFIDSERKVIQDYIRNAASLVRIKLKEADCIEVAADADKLFPTKRQVANSLAVIQHYPEQGVVFLNAIKFLTSADGVQSSREQQAMQMLIEILRRQQNT